MFESDVRRTEGGDAAKGSSAASSVPWVGVVEAFADASSASARSVDAGFDAGFAMLVDAVGAIWCSGVPADARSLVAMRGQLDALHAVVAEAEVRFDAGEVWRAEGAGSMRGWFADACGLPAKEASLAARRVGRLGVWPAVAAAWRSGVLAGSQVDVVVAAVPDRFVSLFAEQAADVVRVLAPLDAAGTRFAMRRWVRSAEAAEGAEQECERPSGVRLESLLDGRSALSGDLCPADAAVLAATFRVFDVSDPVDDSGELIGEPRSLSQRNADALVAACRFALAHRDGPGDTGRFLPHVSLVVDVHELRAAGLRGAGVRTAEDLDELAVARGWSAVERAWFADALHLQTTGGTGSTVDGTELDATALGFVTCDSVVQRVMKAGDVVLNMGRDVRTATPAQRKAIIARDHHCRAPGCQTRPRFCDVHHVDHWINGGRTDVHRMVLLCGTHHREFHRPGYRMELDDHARFTVHAPKGWTRSTVPDHHHTRLFETQQPEPGTGERRVA